MKVIATYFIFKMSLVHGVHRAQEYNKIEIYIHIYIHEARQ